MTPRSIHSYAILLGCILLIASWQIVQAEPAPDKLVVNRETKECALIFGGDECMDCLPPAGWEVLGWSYEAECPAAYAFTQVEEICTPFKNEFCCTEGHSGAHGDCDDLVLNNAAQQCAFVEDINACHLPPDWESKSGDVYWACPGNFVWIKDLDCFAESVSAGGDAGSGSGGLPFGCGSSALGVFLVPAVVFSLARFRRQNAR